MVKGGDEHSCDFLLFGTGDPSPDFHGGPLGHRGLRPLQAAHYQYTVNGVGGCSDTAWPLGVALIGGLGHWGQKQPHHFNGPCVTRRSSSIGVAQRC
ncbi:hypothetical protein INR49_025486, partial [Caranx melampygus]